jgi:uncharacterized protein (TIGR04255 family)
MQQLPERLEHEPLVDALFEVRLNGTPSLTDILPGFLFHDLDPKPATSRLAAADIPQVMRVADPGLQFAPLIRLDWKEYLISVGDRNVLISCKMPYPKWANFKATILNIVGRIAKMGLAGNVERYSLKYVNLIQAPTLAEQIAKIKIAITLGEVEVTDDHATLQVHRHENGIIHILSVIIGAEGQLTDGRKLFGAVVDIDSIRNIEAISFRAFADGLEPGLEELRQANKRKFFSCLTTETIEEMRPVYVRGE